MSSIPTTGAISLQFPQLLCSNDHQRPPLSSPPPTLTTLPHPLTFMQYFVVNNTTRPYLFPTPVPKSTEPNHENSVVGEKTVRRVQGRTQEKSGVHYLFEESEAQAEAGEVMSSCQDCGTFVNRKVRSMLLARDSWVELQDRNEIDCILQMKRQRDWRRFGPGCRWPQAVLLGFDHLVHSPTFGWSIYSTLSQALKLVAGAARTINPVLLHETSKMLRAELPYTILCGSDRSLAQPVIEPFQCQAEFRCFIRLRPNSLQQHHSDSTPLTYVRHILLIHSTLHRSRPPIIQVVMQLTVPCTKLLVLQKHWVIV